MTDPTTDRVLALTGDQTVRQAAHTMEHVLAALAEPGDLLLDCDGVTGADLSLIQIIVAARRSATSRSKRLALTAPPAGALHQALERGGFPELGSADPASWTGRDAAQ
jgi:anti-anti-sigma regulatory factor